LSRSRNAQASAFATRAADLGTQLWADLVGGGTADFHPIGNQAALVVEAVDAVDGSYEDVAKIGLVDEQLRFGGPR
jgi:hypothetical protein